MYPVSDRFRAEVTRSGHVSRSGITVLATGRELVVRGGTVTEDSSQSVRRTLDAQVVDDGGLLPLTPDSPIFPGTAVRAWRSVVFADGTEEQVPLGVLLLGKPEATSVGGTSTVSLHGDDRSAAIASNRAVDPWPVPSGSSLAQTVSDYLADRLPDCPPVALASADVTITTATLLPAGADSDPWANLTATGDTPGLVTRCGRRLWFDADGIPTLYPLDSGAMMTTVDGGTLHPTSIQTAVDPERLYGTVCVSSSPAGGTPLRAVLSDPAAPSAFARRTYFAQMDALTTQDAVDQAAQSLYARVTGIFGSASWDCPPDPSTQAGDWHAPVGSSLLTGAYEIERIATPLGPGTQSIDTVERRRWF